MIKLISGDLKKIKIDALIIPVCEDNEIDDNELISSLCSKAKSLNEFKGEKGEEVVFYENTEVKSDRVVLMGAGKLEKIDTEALRSLAGKAVKQAIKRKLEEITIAVPEAAKLNIKTQDLLQALLEGGYLGNHLFDKYKKEKKENPLKLINFLVSTDTEKKFSSLPERVKSVCSSTIMAREWVTTPSNDKRPEQFIKSIMTNAEKEGLKVNLLNEEELQQKKFGSLLAVAAGSSSRPGVVVLEYMPETKNQKKTLALVGKGVTFDSGGINLKPTGSLEDMKTDMSGAAAVAASLIAIAQIKPDINVVGVIPVVENMPSGTAARPSDIVKTHDGKTVEIGNTDAEGRLILIDAISYVKKEYNPDTLIDMATLTGACVVALGEKIAGVFSSDDDLAKAIVDSGEATHERCWRMPLPDDYKELIKSDLADLSNMSSSRWGGAITAALFLAEFTGDTKWAHIDIAGPASIKKGNNYCGPGGTGFGVRLLCDFIEKL